MRHHDRRVSLEKRVDDDNNDDDDYFSTFTVQASLFFGRRAYYTILPRYTDRRVLTPERERLSRVRYYVVILVRQVRIPPHYCLPMWSIAIFVSRRPRLRSYGVICGRKYGAIIIMSGKITFPFAVVQHDIVHYRIKGRHVCSLCVSAACTTLKFLSGLTVK